MKSTEPTVFLVWDFGLEFPQLRAVDTDVETARKHKQFLERKHVDRAFMIESCSANHLFAGNQLGTLDRIKGRKEL